MLRKASQIPAVRLVNIPAQKCHLPIVLLRKSSRLSTLPTGPIELDPSYQQLLQDVDITLKKQNFSESQPRKELEVLSNQLESHQHELYPEDWTPMDPSLNESGEEAYESEHRKSPAALFGSDQVGAVILPNELQNAINQLIGERHKPDIRQDAVRLFAMPESSESDGMDENWDADYSKKYRSRVQEARHSTRDGAAFAAVALPAHYSAISAVLHHARQRLGTEWEIEKVLDWGAGTGSGLWASLHSFQGKRDAESSVAIDSTVKSYLGIERREGLVAIGEKLVKNTTIGHLCVNWTKSFKQEHIIPREHSSKTLAISAFMLTALSTSIAQKNLVREMWNSGADTIILIDHNTKEGFEVVAHSREYLLQLGATELEDPSKASSDLLGSHVVAPCPHDRPCPLLHSGGAPIVCGFSQRLQRPDFVRRTKHSGVGHEDIEYSYVVIRRGPRPQAVLSNIGRVGAIGKRELKKEQEANIIMKELQVLVENNKEVPVSPPDVEILTPMTAITYAGDKLAPSELQEILRKEAYAWPRLVFPPLKKSGHIVLDSCTAEGKIKRLTIPKSQGKQAFYDARKSSWGDLFPHEPKIAPLERNQPKMRKRDKSGVVGTGADIGKRGKYDNEEGPSYANVTMTGLRPNKKRAKRFYQLSLGSKVWHNVD